MGSEPKPADWFDFMDGLRIAGEAIGQQFWESLSPDATLVIPNALVERPDGTFVSVGEVRIPLKRKTGP